MSRGPYPLLLTMALSTPGAANALGLGDLHVDSRLNQPLSAHIDILGATEQDLLSLSAAIANRDAFQKNGSDRPSFLSSAQFTVTQDQQHRPILSVRSSEPFTEPFVSLLIDLRWPNGSLVREYTLLLDPIGFESNSNLTSVVTSTVPPASSVLPVLTAAPAARDVAKVAESMDPVAPASSHKVSANQTLHGIARLAGARSSVDIRRTMIAIFRANPNAFDGNINRLHRDAVLTLPTPSQIADISKVEANREVRAQMVEWRLDGRPNVSSREGAPEEAPIANTTPAVVAIAAAPAAVHF